MTGVGFPPVRCLLARITQLRGNAIRHFFARVAAPPSRATTLAVSVSVARFPFSLKMRGSGNESLRFHYSHLLPKKPGILPLEETMKKQCRPLRRGIRDAVAHTETL